MLIKENVQEAPLGLDEAILKKYDAEIKNAKKLLNKVKEVFDNVNKFIEDDDD